MEKGSEREKSDNPQRLTTLALITATDSGRLPAINGAGVVYSRCLLGGSLSDKHRLGLVICE